MGSSRRSQLKGHMTSRGIFWMVLALVGHHHWTSLQPLPRGDMFCDTRPLLRETQKQTVVGCRVWKWVICCLCLVLKQGLPVQPRLAWAGTHCVDQASLRLTDLHLLLPSEYWGQRQAPRSPETMLSHISNTHHEVTVRTVHLDLQFSAFLTL